MLMVVALTLIMELVLFAFGFELVFVTIASSFERGGKGCWDACVGAGVGTGVGTGVGHGGCIGRWRWFGVSTKHSKVKHV